MTKYLFLTISLISWSLLTAQEIATLNKTSLPFFSSAISDTVDLDLFLPNEYYAAGGKVDFPLIIVFDKQNPYTYSYNIRTLDMLIFQGQIPAGVVIGYPFDRSRTYYTSVRKKEGEETSGIEKTEQIIFEELIPKMKKEYATNGPIILIGHSRTALLTNYLMVNRHPEFNAAISASGFYNPGFGEPELKKAVSELTQSGHPFSFYFSLGLSTGEEGYKADCDSMATILRSMKIPSNFYWDYIENDQANHFTNYNLTIGPSLTHYFGSYHHILDSWLFEKLKTMKGTEAVTILKKDMKRVSQQLGKPISPSPVHIWSFMSHFYHQKDYKTANALLKYGMEFYPLDYEMAYQLAENYGLMGDEENCQKWMIKCRNLADQTPGITPQQIQELKEQLKTLECYR